MMTQTNVAIYLNCSQKRGNIWRQEESKWHNLSLLSVVVDMLATGKPLPEEYKDHNLSGNYAGCRECHITPDWLLIYEVEDGELILYLTRTGTHSDLF